MGINWKGVQNTLNTAWDGIGDFWNRVTGKAQMQKKEQSFNAAEAQKVRNWETQMSNTAYQRSTADMEKAGLNPAMMYSNGANPASTPGGSSAHSSAPGGISDPTSGISNIINSAANLTRAFNYDKNSKNDVNLNQVTKATTYMQRNGIKNLNSMYSNLDDTKI